MKSIPNPAVKVVAGRVHAVMEQVLPRLGRAYATVPEYAALGTDLIEREVLPVSQTIIETFLEAVLAGREPDAGRIGIMEQMARRRLEMGVGLEPLLHVYRIAATTIWDVIAEETRPGEEGALAPLGRSWFSYMDHASSLAANAYLEASRDQLRSIDARRGALLEALLAAVDPSDVTAVGASFSVTLSGSYVPILVAGADAAAKIDQLAAVCPAGTLSGHRPGGVLLLVPQAMSGFTQLGKQAGGAVVAHGEAKAPGTALSGEVSEVEALATLAIANGVHGVVGPSALIVERLLLGSPRLSARLAERLRPLRADRGAALAATLEAYLSCGSVPSTAERLAVHPNTVTYRLRRIRELTGLDPRVPDDAVFLALGLRATDG